MSIYKNVQQKIFSLDQGINTYENGTIKSLNTDN
jgi:hypothetical protein